MTSFSSVPKPAAASLSPSPAWLGLKTLLESMLNHPVSQQVSRDDKPTGATDSGAYPAKVSLLRKGPMTKPLRPFYQNIALKEVEIARQFNQPMASSPQEAITQMEEAIAALTATKRQVVLWQDETLGTYSCLNDEREHGVYPRELTSLSDASLQNLLHSTELLSVPLVIRDQMVGLLAIAEREDGSPFTVDDQLTLELLAPYVANQVLSYQGLKASTHSPIVQQALLELSYLLVSAVDMDNIVEQALKHLCKQLGFSQGQYILFDSRKTAGWIACEVSLKTASKRKSSQLNATPSALLHEKPLKTLDVKLLAGLVSLFGSSSWQNDTLHIRGEKLGDTPLTQLFQLEQATSALILPVREVQSGALLGLLTLTSVEANPYLPKACLSIAKESAKLVSRALERSSVLERALHLASSDELTGLGNRRVFYERFELELERAKRNGQPICLAIIDVDNFKQFNDTYGHLTGDAVLQGLANLLAANTRKLDLVARFGGEEFVLLLPETAEADAYELMDRLRAKVAKKGFLSVEGQALQITVSIGLAAVSLSRMAVETPTALIEHSLSQADKALYKAKHAGRNQVHC